MFQLQMNTLSGIFKKKYQRVVLNILRSVSEDEKNYHIKAKDYHCWNAR